MITRIDSNHGDASVPDLVEPFAMSLPAVSKHLKVLERAGLIVRGRMPNSDDRVARVILTGIDEATL